MGESSAENSKFVIAHSTVVVAVNIGAHLEAEISETEIAVWMFAAMATVGILIEMISLPYPKSIDVEKVVHARTEKIDNLMTFLVEETSCDGIDSFALVDVVETWESKFGMIHTAVAVVLNKMAHLDAKMAETIID